MSGADWTWNGTGDFANTFVQSGAFRLGRDLTGNVSISAGASLLAGNGANPTLSPNSSGAPITVTNAGTIDLTNGGSATANTLTVSGNYVGAGGTLRLRTMLGTDGSASDKLVIAGAGAAASGTTGIAIVNAGGGWRSDTERRHRGGAGHRRSDHSARKLLARGSRRRGCVRIHAVQGWPERGQPEQLVSTLDSAHADQPVSIRTA